MVIHPGSSAKSFCQILSSYHHQDQALSSSSSLPSQTKSIFVEQSPSHTELKQFLAEMNSPNFNRFDVGEGQLTSTFASTSADNNSNLAPEEEPVGGGGLEQVGKLKRVIVVIVVISTIIIFVVATNDVQGERGEGEGDVEEGGEEEGGRPS